MNSEEEIKKHNLRVLWFITERWFAILQYSIIIGALYVLKEKISNPLIDGIYWISYIVLYMWFLEFSEYLALKMPLPKRFGQWSRFFIASLLVIGAYALITESVKTLGI